MTNCQASCEGWSRAYSDRGKGHLYHHDIEDVVAIVDRRVALHRERAAASEGVRRYVAKQVRGLLSSQLLADRHDRQV
jgi:hypothetical protein